MSDRCSPDGQADAAVPIVDILLVFRHQQQFGSGKSQLEERRFELVMCFMERDVCKIQFHLLRHCVNFYSEWNDFGKIVEHGASNGKGLHVMIKCIAWSALQVSLDKRICQMPKWHWFSLACITVHNSTGPLEGVHEPLCWFTTNNHCGNSPFPLIKNVYSRYTEHFNK